jgi:TonB family protein
MNRSWKRFLLFALLLSFSAPMASAANKKEDAARDLLQRALKQTNLSQLAPVQLTAKVTMPGKKGDVHFDYVVTFLNANKWRTEWSGEGYSRITMVSDGKMYRFSSLPVPPLPILEFEEAVGGLSGYRVMAAPFAIPDLHDAEINVTSRKIQKAPATCASSQKAGMTELCMDRDTAHVLSQGLQRGIAEYGDYMGIGEVQYPQSIQVKVDGQLQADAKISVARAANPPDSLFQPVPNSSVTEFPSCDAPQQKAVLPRLAKKVAPEYPQTARSVGRQGTVWLYAFVAKDGTVQTVRSYGGASQELEKAAIDAVSQWTYSPLKICGQPVEHEALINVSFFLMGQ